MCNDACLEFAATHLTPEIVRGRTVLDVGSLDINGSLRDIVESHSCASYLGVDLANGPGVDRVLRAEELIETFNESAFDVVICTEVLEHVRDWRTVVANLKGVLKVGGKLLVTTRSLGFPYHAFPQDYWRYEVEDFSTIFGDMNVIALQSDRRAPGVFLFAEKTPQQKADLSSLELHSMINNRRSFAVSSYDLARFRISWPIRTRARRLLRWTRKKFSFS